MIAAQTGIYQGLDGITEYVRFTNPVYSDFFLDSSAFNTDPELDLKYQGSEDGNCIFRVIVKTRAILNPATTTGAEYDSVTMIKLLYNHQERYIAATYIYFPEDFLEFWYTSVTTDTGRQVICDVLAGPCSAFQSVEENCAVNLASLPVAQGTLNSIDGDSQGCRALHSILAKLKSRAPLRTCLAQHDGRGSQGTSQMRHFAGSTADRLL